MISVITTGTRPYLAQTLAHASEGTGGARVVLVDGHDLVSAPAGWEILSFLDVHPPRQNKWIGFRAIELAAEAGEDLLFLEDDLELATNAAGRLDGLEVPPGVAFVTFFAPWPASSFPPGLWTGHPNAFVFSQAMKVPHRTCLALASYRRSRRWTEHRHGGFDEIVRLAAMELGWRFAFFSPGLVQHVGLDSAVGNGPLHGPRIARNYVGREVDVNKLAWPREWFR